MAKKNNVQAPKRRNWVAVAAHFKTGSGTHGDKKKQASKNACRGKVKW